MDDANEIEQNKEDKEKEPFEDIYEGKLYSNEQNIRQGSPKLSAFLEQPHEKVKYPEHGIGKLFEIDKGRGTFINQFDGIQSEV